MLSARKHPTTAERAARIYQLGYQRGSAAIASLANREEGART